MTEPRKRPDPRQNGLPPKYDWKLEVKQEETEDEAISRLLARGEAGKKLLRDPDFNAAYHEFLEEQVAQIVTSKPGQRELREDAYFRIRGLQEIAYKMNGWVQMAEQLLRERAKSVGAGDE